MLADLRAEIKPKGILDLERVADRRSIENSRDLRQALKNKWLQLGRHSAIRTKAKPKDVKVIEKTIEKTIERDSIDEERLAKLIRQVIKEESQKQNNIQDDIQDDIKGTIQNSMNSLIASIRSQINLQEDIQETVIDPKQFAELSQKSVEKLSEEIETHATKKPKRINIINKNIGDLADEL